jgi:hypothetical protein
MAISEATRREVFRLDHSECIFWHVEPVEASEVSHFIHQGAGGMPPTHWLNQPPNLGASCHPCHLRFSGPGKVYHWIAWDREGGVLRIKSPRGKLVKTDDLWYYNRERWALTQTHYQALKAKATNERAAAWDVARELEWLAKHGIAAAVNKSADWLDLAAEVGISSTEARRRVRVSSHVEPGDLSLGLDIDVADRLLKLPDLELAEVAEWFRELPLAEAWSRFNERHPGKDRRKRYRAFVGSYREIEAASEDEAMASLGAESIIVKGGSVIRGVRKQEA